MLEFDEFSDVIDTIEKMDAVITNDVIDRASFYDIEEDESSDELITRVSIYDEDEDLIVSIEVEDALIAQSYLEDLFEIEEDETEDGE